MPFLSRLFLSLAVLVLVPTVVLTLKSFRAEQARGEFYGETGHAHGHGKAGNYSALSGYFEKDDFTGGGRAHAHPHGSQVCASGCAASNHPTEPLTKQEFLRLMKEYAAQPMSEDSPALEHLLYYGRQTLLYLDRLGHEPLDEPRRKFLQKELKRTHVLVHFRVVDERGITRVSIPPTRVPLDIRHEFDMDTKDLQPLVTSGTVKRVGLYHIWQRI